MTKSHLIFNDCFFLRSWRFRSKCNRGGIESEFNSHKIVSVSEELMIYMMRLDDIYMNLYNNNERNDNNIGDSGGCSIGEGLKMNSTLTELWLSVRS